MFHLTFANSLQLVV